MKTSGSCIYINTDYRVLRDCSHLATTTQNFYIVRNALHGYTKLLFTYGGQKSNKKTRRCRQVRTDPNSTGEGRGSWSTQKVQ